ncbi:MAG: L,D-transpeptidase family protein [bacterium]|jgi:L,D-transpeptidase ErfK/SrfK|nr:L,D-transpeptidase family protein [Bacillota bacterium]
MGRRLVPLVLVAVIILLYSGSVSAGQSFPNTVTGGQREIWLNIPALRLSYWEDGQLIKEYPVAVGKPTSPTPEGTFTVLNKLVDPTWYPPDGSRPVPPGPGNPLGRRWLGFAPGYGIHGTNAPGSIGRAVSLGCVRMHNKDVEELYANLPLGTPVHIIYETLEARWQPEEGQFSLTLYPDVYGRGVNTLENLQQKMGELGLGGLWSEEALVDLLEKAKQQPVNITIPQISLTLNGRPLELDYLWLEGRLFLPLRPIAEDLGFAVSWEPERGPLVEGEPVQNGIIVEGTTYLALPAFRELLGLKTDWQPEGQNLALYRIIATYNGCFLTDAIIQEEGEYFIGAHFLAAALGIPYRWEPEEGLAYLLEEGIPGMEREGEPYLSLTSLAEKLGPRYGWGLEWVEESYEFRLYDLPEADEAIQPLFSLLGRELPPVVRNSYINTREPGGRRQCKPIAGVLTPGTGWEWCWTYSGSYPRRGRTLLPWRWPRG